jgi:plasmid stabilization system protein ParE
VLRLLVVAVVCAAAAIWIDPAWSGDSRTLRLRVRTGDEIVRLVRAQGVSVAERVADRLRREISEEFDTPPVGAGPVDRTEPGVRITPEERAELDRLIERKTRD